MDLSFQVPMQYCSLQHRILLLSPVTSTAGYCFCFGSIPSFFLDLFLHWPPVAYWASIDLGSSSFIILSFCLFILFMEFSRQEYWNIPGSYAILLFTASDLASITNHVHSWVLFLLWLHPFLLSGVISGVISPLISSSILGTYWPGEFLFQHPIILPFHTVHGVLKARILKWFAIPFSNGPHSVRSLHHAHLSWVAPQGMAVSLS